MYFKHVPDSAQKLTLVKYIQKYWPHLRRPPPNCHHFSLRRYPREEDQLDNQISPLTGCIINKICSNEWRHIPFPLSRYIKDTGTREIPYIVTWVLVIHLSLFGVIWEVRSVASLIWIPKTFWQQWVTLRMKATRRMRRAEHCRS